LAACIYADMQAIAFESGFSLDHLKSVQRPDPAPQANEVLVRVRACSLNYRDLLVSRSQYGRNTPLPMIPLSDGAGEVIAIGSQVSRWKIGDRVAGAFMQTWTRGVLQHSDAASAMGGSIQGMLAEQVCLHERGLVRIPDHLNFEEAATLPCAAVTAWAALFEYGKTLPGQTVLVQGTGGVSIFALQMAKMAGAKVIVTSSSDEKLARAARLGADFGINYRSVEAWDKEAREWTGGRGVDHVIEVGGAGTLPRSLNVAATAGRVSMIGVLTGSSSEISPLMILGKALTVQGIYVGSAEMFERMNVAINQAKLKPIISDVISWRRVREAYQLMASGGHFGKIVVTVD
jgi:NADPH:quinone reductase-like Zn-dependent oxidoreductase